MATLVSPGVSVTITDESFFIPAAAPTVPLIFIATADEKTQTDGITPADGTFESNVVRTITSLAQSIRTYGIPKFLQDNSGAQFHGDARNEYGLFALNQYLGIGNRAYVLRANVNLNDNLDALRQSWDLKFLQSQIVLENLVNEFINEFNTSNGFIPGNPGFKSTVTPTEVNTLARTSTEDIWLTSSFGNSESDYFTDHSIAPFNVFANGYDQPATGTFRGFDYDSSIGTAGGGTVVGNYTPTEAGNLLVQMAGDFKYTAEFLNKTSLGANDAARRTSIVTALQASINNNTDLRSENFDYNLILCPGYHETVDEMISLSVDIDDEALVIADTPMDLDPDGITNPTTGWAASIGRQRSSNVAYYYPSALASNLDGKNVVVSAAGVALRTIAYSDNVSFLWFAPAGLRRGIISGISGLGYITGALGGPTTFIELNLNLGQRNALYQYGASGDINPLTYFPGQGFVVWGQKVSTITASAVDRINVNRMVKYTKRQLRRNTLSFVFEPNDQLTRDNLKGVVDGFLGDLIVKRGLYDFVTVSDTSNNTPDRIDRNEMFIDVALKPIKAAEFIYIPIRIVTTGAVI